MLRWVVETYWPVWPTAVSCPSNRIVTRPKVKENPGTSEMVWEGKIGLVRDEVRERTDGETLDGSIKFFIYRGEPMSGNNYR